MNSQGDITNNRIGPLIIKSTFFTVLASLLVAQSGCDSPYFTTIPDPSFDDTQYWQLIGLVILAAGLLWTLPLIARDILRKLKKKDDLLPAPLGRLLLIRLLSYSFLAMTVLSVIRTSAHPANLITWFISLCWFALAFLMAIILKRLSKKLPILILALALPDIAFIFAILLPLERYGYLPNLPPIIVGAIFLHICFFTFGELRRFLIFKRTFFALAIFIIFAFGPPLKQRSTMPGNDLDLPGRATRLSGTEGKIFSVFVDQKSGFVYYLRKENPQTIYALQPESGRRTSFHDKRERFSKLIQGPDDTMLAISSAPRGRGALLFSLPDLSVNATFTAFNMENKFIRHGPPAYDAVFSSNYLYMMALGDGHFLINRCQLPLDGSPPVGDMGSSCLTYDLPLKKPGTLFLDEKPDNLYVVDKGGLLNQNASLIQIFAKSMEKRKETNFPGAVAGLAMSRDKKALYVSFPWEKSVYFFLAQNPAQGFMAPVHIFPTRLIADSFKKYLYVGSSFFGAIQILRLSDGWASHPIITGPGLNDMALDETKQILYVATDAGLISVNLKMIPMPTGAMRIEPFSNQ
jgi:hypothetical protein